MYKKVFVTRLDHKFTSTFVLMVLKRTFLKHDFLLLFGAFSSNFGPASFHALVRHAFNMINVMWTKKWQWGVLTIFLSVLISKKFVCRIQNNSIKILC